MKAPTIAILATLGFLISLVVVQLLNQYEIGLEHYITRGKNKY